MTILPSKSRIESLSDLIFGLALSIGALALIAHPVFTAADLVRDLAEFALAFTVLIVVWLRYTGSMTYLALETPRVLRLNLLMLFSVAIEPYLFNEVFAPVNGVQVDPSLATFASVAYAVDLALLMGVLASFEHLASRSHSIPPGSDIALTFRRYRNVHLLASAVFLASLLPGLEPVRMVFWFFPLATLGVWRWFVVNQEKRTKPSGPSTR